jgi:cephalosporin hydroxylase
MLTITGGYAGIHEHLPTLRKICFEVEAENIVELGTWYGNSTKAFLEACRVLGAKLISIDIDGAVKDVQPENVKNDPNWTFYGMDDMDFDINFPIDVLFIDSSHTYPHTLLELEKYSPWLTSRGVILMHDTVTCPPVARSIKEFLEKHPNEYSYFNYTNNHGLAVLRKV